MIGKIVFSVGSYKQLFYSTFSYSMTFQPKYKNSGYDDKQVQNCWSVSSIPQHRQKSTDKTFERMRDLNPITNCIVNQ